MVLKLLGPASTTKNPTGRAKSAPRGPSSSKPASTCAKRAQSVRPPRQSGRSAEPTAQEPTKPVVEPPAAEADDEGSECNWKQVRYGQRGDTEKAAQRHKEPAAYREYSKGRTDEEAWPKDDYQSYGGW